MDPRSKTPIDLTPDELRAAGDAVGAALRTARLSLPEHAERPIATWLALVARWRRRRAIAGPRNLADLAVEAVVDSLMADAVIPPSGTVFDIGSGAGIPGIPLAAISPSRSLRLVDSSPVRTGLLRVAIEAAGLDNVAVTCARAEDLARSVEAGETEPADAAVARAVLPPDEWVPLGLRLVRPGGVVAAMTAASWRGPRLDPGTVVVSRREYRLTGRHPRAVWGFSPPESGRRG